MTRYTLRELLSLNLIRHQKPVYIQDMDEIKMNFEFYVRVLEMFDFHGHRATTSASTVLTLS